MAAAAPASLPRSWEGRSALWLLQRIGSHPSCRLVAVDPFEKVHAPFLRNRQVGGGLHSLGYGHGGGMVAIRSWTR